MSRTFVLPQTFDEDLFRDYGEAKTMPFIVFGEFAPWRPWRGETANALMKRYPTMVCPHPGYKAAPGVGIGWVGEDYARALNRAQFSICDGSMFNCVLRKHVEIPASGAVLVSQPIEGLKEYGFVDMENAVIGEGSALMAKLAQLIADPARLSTVAKAGFELAHSRHASRHCDQLYRWFRLRRERKPAESIVQHGTFGPFEVVRDGRSGALRSFPLQPSEITTVYQEAERDYVEGAPSTAARKLVRVLELKKDYAPARFLLVRALLLSGRANDAAQHARFLYLFAKQADQAPEPDPVEWANWVLANICQGNLGPARAALESFPALRHRELLRVRWLAARLSGEAAAFTDAARGDDRPSIAVFLRPTLGAWLKETQSMLRACGQPSLADATAALARDLA